MKTHDLYLSAYLKAKGHKVSAEKERGRCFFVFDSVCQEEVEQFYNDASIGALTYKDSLCNLKSLIHNLGDNNGNIK